MPIYFQFISSCINGISADIISISAYRKAIYDCRKAVPVFFFMLHFFAFYALYGQQDCTRSAKSVLPLKNN
jgi:hypothetical protein